MWCDVHIYIISSPSQKSKIKNKKNIDMKDFNSLVETVSLNLLA